MKISIITISYNSAQTIEQTIQSVLSQENIKLEYIIVDGKSNDGTLKIIKKYESYIDRWISERDKGIYDAMNKGIKLATGDVIGFLNSDDLYATNNILKKVISEFQNKNTDSVYGDLVYVDRNNTNKIIRYWQSKPYQKGFFQKGWQPPHPSFFIKRNIYKKYGLFNPDFEIAADYELMLRFLEKYQISYSYIPEVLVNMRVGGKSNQSIKNIIKANIESYQAWSVNGLKINPIKFLLKPISKIYQYIQCPEKRLPGTPFD